MTLDTSRLVFDWNGSGLDEDRPPRGRVELNDETLRDGLQAPSVRSPSIDEKLEILHCMARLGVDSADIGLPGAGPHVVDTVLRLAHEISSQSLAITANCAARTLRQDIEPIVEISQQAGLPIEVACFLGSSPIRQYSEGWDLDRLVRYTEESVSFAVRNDLPVMFVTEDTTRALPADLEVLYRTAVDAGAGRVCIADTVGHATPQGVRRLVHFARGVVGDDVLIDWHGHRDRGFGVANALAAAGSGADRLHGTALGIGERAGNTEIDLLMVNLRLLGWIDNDLTSLPEYCELVARVTDMPLPRNYPVLGRDAFRTATGVHASAILKARARGDDWLADRVYSGVPASWVGRRQKIEIGPMSGASNVVFWLRARGVEADTELVDEILGLGKRSATILREDDLRAICHRRGISLADDD